MQVIEYVVVTVGETPDEPEVPLGEKLVPVQALAFVEFHVSVEALPLVIVVGFAESVTVGEAGVAATENETTVSTNELFPAVSLHLT